MKSVTLLRRGRGGAEGHIEVDLGFWDLEFGVQCSGLSGRGVGQKWFRVDSWVLSVEC